MGGETNDGGGGQSVYIDYDFPEERPKRRPSPAPKKASWFAPTSKTDARSTGGIGGEIEALAGPSGDDALPPGGMYGGMPWMQPDAGVASYAMGIMSLMMPWILFFGPQILEKIRVYLEESDRRSAAEAAAAAQREKSKGLIDVSDYEKADAFDGAREGWVFKSDEHGLGYYRDTKPYGRPIPKKKHKKKMSSPDNAEKPDGGGVGEKRVVRTEQEEEEVNGEVDEEEREESLSTDTVEESQDSKDMQRAIYMLLGGKEKAYQALQEAVGTSAASAWEASLAAKKRNDHLGVMTAASYAISRFGSGGDGGGKVPLEISLAFRDVANAHLEMHKAAVAKLPPPAARPSRDGEGMEAKVIDKADEHREIEREKEKEEEIERRRQKAAKGKGQGKGKGKGQGKTNSEQREKEGKVGSETGADADEEDGAWPSIEFCRALDEVKDRGAVRASLLQAYATETCGAAYFHMMMAELMASFIRGSGSGGGGASNVGAWAGRGSQWIPSLVVDAQVHLAKANFVAYVADRLPVDVRVGMYMAGIQSAMTARQLINMQAQSRKQEEEQESNGETSHSSTKRVAEVAELGACRRQTLYVLGELSLRCAEVFDDKALLATASNDLVAAVRQRVAGGRTGSGKASEAVAAALMKSPSGKLEEVWAVRLRELPGKGNNKKSNGGKAHVVAIVVDETRGSPFERMVLGGAKLPVSANAKAHSDGLNRLLLEAMCGVSNEEEMRRGRALGGPPRRPHRVVIDLALLEALNRADDEACSAAVTGMLDRVQVECELGP